MLGRILISGAYDRCCGWCLDKLLYRRNLRVVHVLLDEAMEGAQPEMSPKRLELFKRLMAILQNDTGI